MGKRGLPGATNPNWKGGRTIDPRGYVLVKRPGHPRADVRGYVYEHVLVVEQKIGRPLVPGEEVHHKNEVKTDNRPENLKVCKTKAEHRFHHRKPGSRLRAIGEDNPVLSCACGCGAVLAKYDGDGRPRTYVSGHNETPSPTTDAIVAALKGGPIGRKQVIEMTGLSTQAVAVALSKLRRRGVAEPVERGVWKLKGETDVG